MKVLKQIGKSMLYAIVIMIVAGFVNIIMLSALKNLAPNIMIMITLPIFFVILCISYYITHLGK